MVSSGAASNAQVSGSFGVYKTAEVLKKKSGLRNAKPKASVADNHVADVTGLCEKAAAWKNPNEAAVKNPNDAMKNFLAAAAGLQNPAAINMEGYDGDNAGISGSGSRPNHCDLGSATLLLTREGLKGGGHMRDKPLQDELKKGGHYDRVVDATSGPDSRSLHGENFDQPWATESADNQSQRADVVMQVNPVNHEQVAFTAVDAVGAENPLFEYDETVDGQRNGAVTGEIDEVVGEKRNDDTVDGSNLNDVTMDGSQKTNESGKSSCFRFASMNKGAGPQTRRNAVRSVPLKPGGSQKRQRAEDGSVVHTVHEEMPATHAKVQTQPPTSSYANVVNGSSRNSTVKVRFIQPEAPNADDDVVDIPVEVVRKGSTPYVCTLYGYFVGRKLAYPIVNFHVRNMWKPYGIEDVLMNDQGFFFFKFANESGMTAVLENGPWLIKNVPIFVQRWEPGLCLAKPKHDKIPLWVKIFDVPLELWNGEGLSYIASKLGVPLAVDSWTARMCENATGRAGYARILVEVSAEANWRDEIRVLCPKLNGLGKTLSILRVEYTWRPPRCSLCKVYGHDDKTCVKNIAEMKEKTNIASTSDTKGNGVKEVDSDGFQKVTRKEAAKKSKDHPKPYERSTPMVQQQDKGKGKAPMGGKQSNRQVFRMVQPNSKQKEKGSVKVKNASNQIKLSTSTSPKPTTTSNRFESLQSVEADSSSGVIHDADILYTQLMQVEDDVESDRGETGKFMSAEVHIGSADAESAQVDELQDTNIHDTSSC